MSLVVKIEVEACSYRALFTSVPCNRTLDVNKIFLMYQFNTTSEPCSHDYKIKLRFYSCQGYTQVCLVMVFWNMTKALLVYSIKRKWCDGGDGAEPTKLVTVVVTWYTFSDEAASYFITEQVTVLPDVS